MYIFKQDYNSTHFLHKPPMWKHLCTYKQSQHIQLSIPLLQPIYYIPLFVYVCLPLFKATIYRAKIKDDAQNTSSHFQPLDYLLKSEKSSQMHPNSIFPHSHKFPTWGMP